MYSTIKRKSCKHEGCTKMPQISCAGYCWDHCPEEIKLKYKSKRELQIKKSNAAKLATSKLRMDNYKSNVEQDLWYRARSLEVSNNQKCWECGRYVPTKYVRAASAHILFKSIFESVATHPLNFLFLCGANGCHEKSHTIETFSKMTCFPIAIERFYLFEKEIKEHHKYLELFKEAIKNYKQ